MHFYAQVALEFAKNSPRAISTVKTRNMILSKSSPFRTKVRFTREESEHDFQTCAFPMVKSPIGSPKWPSEGPLGCLFGPLGGLSGTSGGLLGRLGVDF